MEALQTEVQRLIEENTAAAAAAGGPCPTARRRTRLGGGGGRSRSVALTSIGGSSCPTRCTSRFCSKSDPRVPLDVVDQQPQQDSPQVCARTAVQLQEEYPQGPAEPFPQWPALEPQRGHRHRYAADRLLLGAGHLRSRLDACGPLPGEGLVRGRPPATAPEPPPSNVHTGGVGGGTSWGVCAGGLCCAVVIGSMGRASPFGKGHAAALCRFAPSCWWLLCNGLRCSRIAGF